MGMRDESPWQNMIALDLGVQLHAVLMMQAIGMLTAAHGAPAKASNGWHMLLIVPQGGKEQGSVPIVPVADIERRD